MRRPLGHLLVAMLAAVLFAVCHWLLQPAPVPALWGLVGGLVGIWWASGPMIRPVGAGLVGGVVFGSALHLYSHYAEGRIAEPIEGIALHLLYDVMVGVLVAAPILGICAWTTRRRVERTT